MPKLHYISFGALKGFQTSFPRTVFSDTGVKCTEVAKQEGMYYNSLQ